MILLIESSAQFPSVGLCNLEGELIAQEERIETYSHAESLAEMVQSLLYSISGDALQIGANIGDEGGAKAAQHEISAIAISSGPGSYTGLRIGTSLAKGLALGFQVPLISACAMEGMVQQQLAENPQLKISFAMLDARRNEVYLVAKNQNGETVVGPVPKILDPEDWFLFLKELGISDDGMMDEWGCISDCNQKVAEILQLSSRTIHVQENPHVKHLAKISAQKFVNKEFEDLAYFEPNYLKEFVAGIGKKFQL